MMMGVFQIHGMEPGPLVFITSLDLIWVTFAAMFFANICILGPSLNLNLTLNQTAFPEG